MDLSILWLKNLCLLALLVSLVQSINCPIGFYPTKFFGDEFTCHPCPEVCADQGLDKDRCKKHCHKPSPSTAFVLAPSATIIPSLTSTFKGGTTQQPTRIPSSAIPSLSKDHHVSTIMSTSSSGTKVAPVTIDVDGKDFPVWIIILCVVLFLVLAAVILLIYRHKTRARKNLYKSQDIIDEMDTTSV
ncbi:uncharacterized protein LOC124436766 isoform X2 [Xenia sp. Carnegie-2017]|uniref:uncharacterized protein LOC124436766 isoform X2 n=1 Tax=Xenia sp. Carnegie-2017 TaxID=2897299 RepID=UPI001F046BBF|nr:uncharacterized protein LOC124436766 isoform X2 [Xenia sp. Carnegie-2017]